LHSDTPRFVGTFWTSDHPDTQRPLSNNTQQLQQTSIHAPRPDSNQLSQQPSGRRATIIDREATGISRMFHTNEN
jgi:hypothetical protein